MKFFELTYFSLLISVILLIFGVYLIFLSNVFQLKLLGVGILILGVVIGGLGLYVISERNQAMKKPTTSLPPEVEIATEVGNKSKPTRTKFFNIREINFSSKEITEEKINKHSSVRKRKLFPFFDSFFKAYFKPKIKDISNSTKSSSEISKVITPKISVLHETERTEETEGFKIKRVFKKNDQTRAQLPIENQQTEETINEQSEVAKIDGNSLFQISKTERTFSNETGSEKAIEKERKALEDSIQENIIIKPQYQRQSFIIDSNKIFISEDEKDSPLYQQLRNKLKEVLSIIPSVTNTQTAVFLQINPPKNLLRVESVVSEYIDLFKKEIIIPLGEDIISQIFISGQPEIIMNLNPNSIKDLIPYYSKNVEVGSFIGVPLYYNTNIIGLLCADSKSPKAYDEYTVNFLLYLSRIIFSYLENFSRITERRFESNLLNILSQIRENYFAKNISIKSLIKNFVTSIYKNFYHFTTVGIAILHLETNEFAIFDVRSKSKCDVHLINRKIKLHNTYLGSVINNGKTIFYPIVPKKIRIHANETPLKEGNFYGFPIRSYIGIVGAVFGYTEKGVEIDSDTLVRIEDMLFILGLILQFSILYTVKNDYEKQLLGPIIPKKEKFIKTINEEIERCKTFGGIFSLCLFSIDKGYSLNLEFESRDVLEQRAKAHLEKLVLEQINSYDKFGIIDENIYGLLLVGKDETDTYYFMEEIRQKFALSVVQYNNQKYFFTMSCGIEQFELAFSLDLLYSRCYEALEIAQKDRNKVVRY